MAIKEVQWLKKLNTLTQSGVTSDENDDDEEESNILTEPTDDGQEDALGEEDTGSSASQFLAKGAKEESLDDTQKGNFDDSVGVILS